MMSKKVTGGDLVLMPFATEFSVIEKLVDVIEKLADILQPFNDATEILSGDSYPTIGLVQPLFHQLLMKY